MKIEQEKIETNMLLVCIHNNVITVDENKSGIFHFYEIKMAKLHLPLEEENILKRKSEY